MKSKSQRHDNKTINYNWLSFSTASQFGILLLLMWPNMILPAQRLVWTRVIFFLTVQNECQHFRSCIFLPSLIWDNGGHCERGRYVCHTLRQPNFKYTNPTKHGISIWRYYISPYSWGLMWSVRRKVCLYLHVLLFRTVKNEHQDRRPTCCFFNILWTS